MKAPFMWISRLVFPPRASTQTWMFLTFALFVGMAVAGVALYVFFIVGSQIKDAARDTHIAQAEQIASFIEDAAYDAERTALVESISDITGLHILVARRGEILWSKRPEAFVSTGDFMRREDVLALAPGGGYFVSERTENGSRVTFAAVHREESGFVIGIEQTERAFHTVGRNMQRMLVLGLIMVFLMALLGSWVAADKVTKPLLAIRKSAKEISDGKLDRVITVDTRSAEIQDLASSLRRMSKSFRKKILALERLTELQKEFIGSISHEVRNPIFSVSGYLEALADPRLPEELRRRYAAKALKNLHRLGNLFHDLIELARLESEDDIIKREAFDLADLANEVGDMLCPKAEEKGLDFTYDGPVTPVLADRNRIQQVLVNLCMNGIRYSDSGSVRCTYERGPEKVRIDVVDSGRGIGKDHLDRIFERFYVVDANRTRKSGGTGLGLSIVKQILQAHGESIHVESTQGHGSTFWFELPAA